MYRIIYKSKSVAPVDWPLVQQILHNSEQNNRENDISGVLIATLSHFLQFIEGTYEAVNSTFMRIVKDPRHHDIKLVCFSVIDGRIFKEWGMRGLGVFDFNKELEQQLISKYGEEQGSVKFPIEDWLALSLINDINMIHKIPDWKSS